MWANISSIVLPAWGRWAMLAAVVAASYGMGMLHEAERAGEAHSAYVQKQAGQTIRIVERQVKVASAVQIEYRDRIKKIYLQGEQIEKVIDHYITPSDDQRFAVNNGFVRVYDAAWSGEASGPASDADREPSGIPLSVVGEVETHNATSCRVWREQALGWRVFYARQQAAINAPPDIFE